MHILVCDNNPGTKILLSSKFQVTFTTSAESARLYLQDFNFDLIVTEFHPEVIEEAARRRVPCLILSDYQITTVLRAFGLGADDYVAKPFHAEELIARILAIKRRCEQRLADVIQLPQDVTIDLQTRVVRVAGEKLHLTNKQFQVLAVLARRAPHVVTKDSIIDQIYSPQDDCPNPKIIDVFICHLRNKLPKGLIKTEWGQGYYVAA